MAIDARVEHVGSLLRPQFLREAREAARRGEVTPAGFKAAEDRAVREVVALQEEIGLPVVNDGEQRRDSFQAELAAACDGFAGVSLDAWLWGDWHSAEVGESRRPARRAWRWWRRCASGGTWPPRSSRSCARAPAGRPR